MTARARRLALFHFPFVLKVHTSAFRSFTLVNLPFYMPLFFVCSFPWQPLTMFSPIKKPCLLAVTLFLPFFIQSYKTFISAFIEGKYFTICWAERWTLPLKWDYGVCLCVIYRGSGILMDFCASSPHTLPHTHTCRRLADRSRSQGQQVKRPLLALLPL